VDAWVRAFTVELVESKRRAQRAHRNAEAANNWRIFAPPDHPLAVPARDALAATGVGGVAVCLPERPDLESVPLLLDAGHAVLAMRESPRFVVVQHGWGGGGFARTLHLENPAVATCVMNVPPDCLRALEWVAAEVPAVTGFTEVHFTEDGRRLEPRLKLAGIPPETTTPETSLGREDVLLVTGGGQGIAAECGLMLARQTGVKLALVGRTDPNANRALAGNLARIAASGVSSSYARADVLDPRSLQAAVAEIEGDLGRVTAVLHGAGVNTPQLIGALDRAAFERTLAPKLMGARNVLAAVDVDQLKLLVTFGSIIARTGLPGEADYATANEWLAALTNEFQSRHPRCRCLVLEWSIWSGAGMGQRLGRIESLARNGITAISADEGARAFCRFARERTTTAALVVAGRFGEPPTLQLADAELPLRRFLERKRVFYPGVELVVDAQLSVSTDPYLEDHVVQKQPLLPAVLGLEAMAQTAMALSGSRTWPVFESVEFHRPVAVTGESALTIRLAALRRENGSIETCLRSQETDFQVDHFRAQCRFDTPDQIPAPLLPFSPSGSPPIALDPRQEVYGRVLFHRGRFRRVSNYRLLKAKECVAEITPDDGASWFGPYRPGEFVLGDPAGRDAALHAIQACIPHRRILPTGIERLFIRRLESGPRFVRAQERHHQGNDFVYDLEVMDACGDMLERWDGLRLRAVETLAAPDDWPDSLLAPYWERRLEEFIAATQVAVALERRSGQAGPAGADAVIQRALGKAERLWRRPDGRPVSFGDREVSAAHTRDFTLAVAGLGATGCDLEEVAARPETVWRDLLGAERFHLVERIVVESGQGVDNAATRVWAAMECLKKMGRPLSSPLVLTSNTDDGWTLLQSGPVTITTHVTKVRGAGLPLVVAIALGSHPDAQPALAQRAAVPSSE
jgi:enediyne polyketide synthase